MSRPATTLVPPKTPSSIKEWIDSPDDSWRPYVSFFLPPIQNTFPSERLSLAEVHARICGNEYAEITARLRQQEPGKQARAFKASFFPYVCFAGVFSRRSDSELLRPSQLLTIDLDHLPNPQEVRQQLLEDPNFETELLFYSPSGNGIKWIIRQDPYLEYRDCFRAVSFYLKQRYGLETDASGKDVSRACFLAADKFCYLHKRHRREQS